MIFGIHVDSVGDVFAQGSRIISIILLSVALGLMVRFYLTRPRMPVKALVGYCCFTVALLGTEAYKVATPGEWRWWLTPFVIAGSIAVISGVWPALQWRHRQKKG